MGFPLKTPLACIFNLLALSDVLPWRLLENQLKQIWLFLLAMQPRFSRFQEREREHIIPFWQLNRFRKSPVLSHLIFSADWLWDFIPATNLPFYETPKTAAAIVVSRITQCFSIASQLKQIGLWKVHFAAKTGHPRTQKTPLQYFKVCASSPSGKASRVFPR